MAMVTELYNHFILQWYETHTMLCNGMKCIPVLILKNLKTHIFSNKYVSQINKFFVNCNSKKQSIARITAADGMVALMELQRLQH